MYGRSSDILSHLNVKSVQECAAKAFCSSRDVNFWTYNLTSKECSMKASNSEKMASQEHVSGSVYCAARLQQIQGLIRKIKSKQSQIEGSNCRGRTILTPPTTTPTSQPAADLSEYLSKLTMGEPVKAGAGARRCYRI